ncbi:type II toxin-antitoxin system RelE/ParE family toxin [Prosthecobacter fusiformis]|uniref:type II toxin-antitoxin system RelE/ParE family toxin n=1 Tax=Prosthecobacter fusiformis TaxID=48464 RepID=UPI0010621FF8|nr:type II toxin-antitoxin system RelE/ParE family toxin [Prosthecobacter fusiformis]
MAEIIYAPVALEDLRDVWIYIADDSVRQADLFMFKLRDRIAHLASHNGMGRSRPELAPALRSSPFGKYIIFHRQIDGGIEVVRIIHSSRDLNRIQF